MDKKNEISSNLNQFIENIESIHSTIPMFMVILSEIRKKSVDSYSDYLKENGELIKENKNLKRYKLATKFSRKADIIEKRSIRAKKSLSLIPKNFVVSLVSEYDSFLGNLLKSFYRKKPELLNSIERKISYTELVCFESIDNARDHILEKEVESVLRKSHTEHFDIMEKKFSINLRKNLKIWSDFIELTERRNLFVHCNGIVTSQYLSVCSQNNVNIKSKKAGQKLVASADYIENSFRILNEIAIKLTHVLWRKVFPDERKSADDALISLSYDLLQQKRYSLVINVLDLFINTIKKFHDDTMKRFLIINLSIAYKLSGDKKSSDKELSKYDWSSCDYLLKLAHSVLLEDYDKSANFMRKVIATKDLSEDAFLHWPLFEDFRKEDQFKEIFLESFGKEAFEIDNEKVEEIESNDSVDDINDEFSPKKKNLKNYKEEAESAIKNVDLQASVKVVESITH